MKLFQFAIIWMPTEKQIKEEGKQAIILVDITSIIAVDEQSVLMKAATRIPGEYADRIDQIKIPIRPF